jgi:YggT family protein
VSLVEVPPHIKFLLAFTSILFQILYLAIVGRALLSWFPVRPGNPFFPLAVILNQITEPILAPLRRVIPTIGMIDITPIVALILLQIVQQVVDTALRSAISGGF